MKPILRNSKVFHSVQCQVVPESIAEHLILEKFLGGMKENIQSPTNFYTAVGGKGTCFGMPSLHPFTFIVFL